MLVSIQWVSSCPLCNVHCSPPPNGSRKKPTGQKKPPKKQQKHAEQQNIVEKTIKVKKMCNLNP